MRNQLILLSLMAILGLSTGLHAQVVTWGSYGGVDVTVTTGLHVHTGHFLNTGAGTQFTNNGNIYLRNNFNQTNSASYVGIGGGWIWFQGSALQTISSDFLVNIANMRVDNAAGVQLNQSLLLPTSLEILNGDLNLNDFDVDLGNTGTLSENRLNNHLVVDNSPGLTEANTGGHIRASNRPTSGILNEIAGLGIFLTDAGIVNIDRHHYAGTMGGTTIMKNYEITGTPSNTTMRIEFASDEALSVSVNSTLKLLRFNGTLWEDKGGTWVDLPVDYVEQTGILSFSPWSVGNPGSLPITWVDFQAHRTSPLEVLLTWETATEVSNAGFEVEKSYDGQQFSQIGFVPGAINSSTIQAYDHTTPEPEAAYYRLRQVDQNGGFAYSEVRFVDGGTQAPFLVLHPNPAHDWVKMEIVNGQEDEVYQFQVVQADGKLVANSAGTVTSLQQYLDEIVPSLAKGLYLLRLESPENVFVRRLILF